MDRAAVLRWAGFIITIDKIDDRDLSRHLSSLVCQQNTSLQAQTLSYSLCHDLLSLHQHAPPIMSPSDRSHSRTRTSRSRPRNSRDPSAASISQVQSLILPDGTVGEEATQLLQDFVHPRDDVEETLLEEDEVDHTISDDERDNRYLPWWKRPSPLWSVGFCVFPH